MQRCGVDPTAPALSHPQSCRRGRADRSPRLPDPRRRGKPGGLRSNAHLEHPLTTPLSGRLPKLSTAPLEGRASPYTINAATMQRCGVDPTAPALSHPQSCRRGRADRSPRLPDPRRRGKPGGLRSNVHLEHPLTTPLSGRLPKLSTAPHWKGGPPPILSMLRLCSVAE